MENWRRQRRDTYGVSEELRRRSMRKKPPRLSWQPTVPSWEKKFCKVVGALDWETILDMKKFVHLYDNVVKWNDSAGEEAFHNAKKRFLAKMHGHPCDISLPSPDLYIDEVDWDAEVDFEALVDLEHDPLVPSEPEMHEPVVIFGDALICGLGLSSAGWGDEEQNFRKATNSCLNNCHTPWEQMPFQSKEITQEDGYVESDYIACPLDEGGGVQRDTGWGNGWENLEGTDNNGGPGVWQVSDWENGNSGRHETSFNSSRYMNGNNSYYNGGYRWRSGSGRKRETVVNS